MTQTLRPQPQFEAVRLEVDPLDQQLDDARLLGGEQLLLNGYSPIDAYMLCSVCADLRISSIVDVPNWVVSFYFPRIVLE